MSLLERELVRCEQCGAVMEGGSTEAGCLNCLLGGGLSELRTESRRFQHYQLCLRSDGTLDELGRGAMGITYRALDLNLDSSVALKVISAAHSDKPEARERFRREARAAAQLRHPNVASVFHFGETSDGQFFYAMELVEGETLEARVRRDGPLPAEPALQVAEQVCRALVAAEAHGLVHRDLKPSNLMVVPNEFTDADAPLVKVIDFGLAQAVVALQEGDAAGHASFSGTPEFASPEQFDAKGFLDVRSDIYSLGATLWYLLCGQSPFSNDFLNGSGERRLPLDQLTEAKVPAPLVGLLRSMLASDPAQRPQTARQLLTAVRVCRATTPRRNLRRVVLCLSGLVLLGLLALLVWNREPPPPTGGIAVLPFANLDGNKENIALADGIQNDILTRLTRVPDLRVISRTSVMQYRGAQNARKVGRALNVSHILEGSVRSDARRIHLNVQLIDTRTDQPLWGERFDRDLDDVLATQSGIAHDVAEVLQLELSPSEKAAFQSRPSKDPQANDLYALGAPIVDSAISDADVYATNESDTVAINHGIDLLDKAVTHDPKLFLAYCKLAKACDFLSLSTNSPAHLAKAQKAIDAATQLAPDSGETHLAHALHLYWGHRNYDGAHAELALAKRSFPNDARISQLNGYIDRRQGRWDEAVQEFRHALELDPQNNAILHNLEATYNHLRRYDEESAILDRGLALYPNDFGLRVHRAGLEVRSRADLESVPRILQEFVSENPSALKELAWSRFEMALFHRDLDAAGELLSRAEGSEPLQRAQDIPFPHAFFEGWLARMKGDEKTAQERLLLARAQQEKAAPNQPLEKNLVVLGLIDTLLGRKQEAMEEGRRAMNLMPISRDAWDGPQIMFCFAAICAWSGEHDLALSQLQQLATVPAGVHYGHLVLDPLWDPLRGDPRFEKVAASLAPTNINR